VARRLAREQRGFTLIEIMIVILVIAILAAIALPSFLGNRAQAYDADAKSAARNLVSFIQACNTSKEDYRDCATQADLDARDLPWGSDPGEVSVTSTTKTSYEVKAISHAETDGTNHSFTISGGAGGGMVLTCDAGPNDNAGGCKSGVW
jgi:type IV pilus assembly protein PilA